MEPYLYSPLNVQKQEIRIVHLLPGALEDLIQLYISHVPLIVSHSDRQPSLLTKEIQESLPIGWFVHETLDSNIIYDYEDFEKDILYSTWDHPVVSYRAKYTGSAQEPRSSSTTNYTKPLYEALSYAWGDKGDFEIAYVHRSIPPSGSNLTALHTLPILELYENLANALKRLRYTDKSRALWIDALWYVNLN
jgi:hypothetical protein